jgi:L-asparaginase
MNSIHVIITGGTIDSYYDGAKDTVVPNQESVIPEFIDTLKSYDTTFEFTTVCMKDSRNLNDADRQKILEVIEQSKHDKILITHGTYTMPDTARYLKANLKRDDQVIILTASMIPIKGFSPSDGTYNLGYSVAKLQDLSKGMYVCMNNHVFDPEEVVKDLAEGKFTSVFFRGTPEEK